MKSRLGRNPVESCIAQATARLLLDVAHVSTGPFQAPCQARWPSQRQIQVSSIATAPITTSSLPLCIRFPSCARSFSKFLHFGAKNATPLNIQVEIQKKYPIELAGIKHSSLRHLQFCHLQKQRELRDSVNPEVEAYLMSGW